MASNGASTAYDIAIAAATDAEKERLKALRLRLNIPPDSPEWQFYAVLAPLLTAGSHDEFRAQLDRIEARAKKTAATAPAPIVGGTLRDLIVVALTVAMCVVVAVLMGAGTASFAQVLSAFALGVAATLGYVVLAPLIGRRS